MLTFEQLVQDVGQWSKANFEETYHKELPYRWKEAGAGVEAGLGSIAPLLGIGEEIGELGTATIAQDFQEIEDAIGDILIYLADWCFREGVPFPEVKVNSYGSWKDGDNPVSSFLQGVSIGYGKMLHAKLKRCQNIRGMDNDLLYRPAMEVAMETLVSQLQSFSLATYSNDPEGASLLVIANHTWETVVSKRQWKTWPRTGTAS